MPCSLAGWRRSGEEYDRLRREWTASAAASTVSGLAVGEPRGGTLPETRHIESDQELIRRTLRGDRECYGILLQRYQRGLYALIRGMVQNHDDADDLTQEAFLRAYRYLDRFQQDRTFRPWLYRIGVNLALHHLRRRRTVRWLSLDDEDPETGIRLLDVMPSAGAEEAVRRPAEARRLAEAVDQVPPGFRAVLILRAVEGLHYEEIAAIMGIPVGTVMSRLSRARAGLRVILAGPRIGAAPETNRGMR